MWPEPGAPQFSERIAAMDGWTTLLVHFLVVYGILLGIYFAGGAALSYWNRRHMAARKIQPRTPDPDLIRRDILQSTFSLSQIAFFFAIGSALRAAGFGILPYDTELWSVLVFLPVSMVLFDAWFYWGHRLLHTPALYRTIHQWHHVSITPTPWSNNSDKFLDNLFLQSYWMVAPLVLPAPTLVFLLHKIYDHVTGIIGHSGHEYNPSSSRWSLFPSVTHHDLHHSHQKYNFGSTFVYWDVLMNTLHPEYYARMDRLSAAPRSKAA
jgi:sterol desaturase/sphingolipid hydroxylase (fatty acid hydroxylase superfamily)